MLKRDKNDSPHNNLVALVGIVVLAIGIAVTLVIIEMTPDADAELPPATPPAQSVGD